MLVWIALEELAWIVLEEKFREACNDVVKKVYSLSAYVTPFIPVANYLYRSSPLPNIYRGFSQLFRLPTLLETAYQTRDIIVQSVNSNAIDYFLPVMAYSRFNQIVVPHYLEKYDLEFFKMPWRIVDYTITAVVLSRLFLRHSINNLSYAMVLSRSVSNDTVKYLANVLSKSITAHIWHSFNNIYLDGIYLNETKPEHCRVIKDKLHCILSKFFSQGGITRDSFTSLINPMTDIFLNVFDDSDVPKRELTLFFQYFSQMLAHVFASTYLPALSPAVYVAQKSLIDDVLEKKFPPRVAAQYAENFLAELVKIHTEVASRLPIHYIPGCDDGLKKKLHASLSSSLYVQGILFLLKVPNFLQSLGSISAETNSYLNVLVILVNALVMGQTFDEYEVAAGGQCTRHRYQLFAKRRAQNFGRGLSYVATLEGLKYGVQYLTGIQNFFTTDALSNMSLQCVMATSLAYRLPFNQEKYNAWDIFYYPRKAILNAFNVAYDFLIPDLDQKESREKFYQQIKNRLGSPCLKLAAQWIFEGNKLLPSYTLTEKIRKQLEERNFTLAKTCYFQSEQESERKQIAFERKIRSHRDEKKQVFEDIFAEVKENKVISPPKEDLRSAILNFPAMILIFNYHREDFLNIITKIESGHEWAKYLSDFFLSAYIQSFMGTMVTLPLLLVTDEVLVEFLKELKLYMKNYKGVAIDKILPRVDWVVDQRVISHHEEKKVALDSLENEIASALQSALPETRILPTGERKTSVYRQRRTPVDIYVDFDTSPAGGEVKDVARRGSNLIPLSVFHHPSSVDSFPEEVDGVSFELAELRR